MEDTRQRDCDTAVGHNLQAYIEFVLGIAAAVFAADSMLMLSPWGDRMVGFAVCAALVGVSAHTWPQRRPAKAGVALALFAWAWVSFRVAEPLPRLALLAWFFAGLHVAVWGPRTRCPDAARASRFFLLHLSSLSYAVVLAVYSRSDQAWFLVRRLLEYLAHLGNPTGAWAAGLPVYVLGFLVLLWGAALGYGRKGYRDSARGCLGLLVAGFVASQAVFARVGLTGALKVSLQHLSSLGVVALALSLAERAGLGIPFPCRWQRRANVPSQSPAQWMADLPRLLSLLTVSAALTAAGLALGRCVDTMHPCAGPFSGSCPIGKPPGDARPSQSASFAVYSSGMLDWAVPDSTHLGLLNSGMFGLFRRSLERCALGTGGRVTVLDSLAGSITPDTLEETALLIFINPTTVLAEEALCAIRDFVRSGGGLLVAGDHTDMLGSRKPLNAVLSFTKIRFNFDSAVPLRQHWRGCLEVRWRPPAAAVGRSAARGLPRDPNLHLQIAVGASLDIERPAFPVVVGRYGFADGGDPLNGGSQAFMGNLAHDRGERFGDLVLVAAEDLGRGRVLVFGDTSPFQNGALFLSQDLVSGAVRWLLGGKTCGAAKDLAWQNLAWSEQHAVIDFSTRPKARASLFSETSLGGLANCLAREGIASRPAFSSSEWTPDALFLFLTSPTVVPARDIDRLIGYMEDGGNVILAQGYAEPQPCDALLQAMDLGIQDIPLGRGDSSGGVTHNDAYAIRLGTERDDLSRRAGVVLARAFGHPTIVVRRCGRGSFTLVSDGGFFLDVNLEGERTCDLGNMGFFHHLLGLLRRETGQGAACSQWMPYPDAWPAWDLSYSGAKQTSN